MEKGASEEREGRKEKDALVKFSVVPKKPFLRRLGMVFGGLACEIPLFLLELEKHCPRCWALLEFSEYNNETGAGTDTEYCLVCGYYKKYRRKS